MEFVEIIVCFVFCKKYYPESKILSTVCIVYLDVEAHELNRKTV